MNTVNGYQAPALVDRVRACHAAWRAATGQDLGLDMSREQAWFEWLKRGLGAAEVGELVRYHRRERQAGRPARRETFRSLIVNVDWAEEDLAMMRARGRVKHGDPGREGVLRATGRNSEQSSVKSDQSSGKDERPTAEQREQVSRALRELAEQIKGS